MRPVPVHQLQRHSRRLPLNHEEDHRRRKVISVQGRTSQSFHRRLEEKVVAALSSTKALLASDSLIFDLWSLVNSDPSLILVFNQNWIERRLATCAR
jgi:hypothetical protein